MPKNKVKAHKHNGYVVWYSDEANKIHWVIQSRMSWYTAYRTNIPARTILGSEKECEDATQLYMDGSYANAQTEILASNLASVIKQVDKEQEPAITRYSYNAMKSVDNQLQPTIKDALALVFIVAFRTGKSIPEVGVFNEIGASVGNHIRQIEKEKDTNNE